jgi:2-polyprenyl-3-methyl-5-hydroxy-6-metoxy-1,4-benzoquinol methylase
MQEWARVQGSHWPTDEGLAELFRNKYSDWENVGWGPKLRARFGYFTPDDYYEALVANLVIPGSNWADVGCGRDIFPSNRDLARDLSSRAGYVLGIDPDPNIRENEFLSEAVQGMIDDYVPGRLYDVVTLRMVAEHVEHPASAITSISRMLKPGGHAVIYTPHKWAVLSIFARLTPLSAHHFFKKILWNTEERDTFPVQFKMNTGAKLGQLFHAAGFTEAHFELIDDCRVFQNYYPLSYLELLVHKLFTVLRLPYPECCIIGVYRKN